MYYTTITQFTAGFGDNRFCMETIQSKAFFVMTNTSVDSGLVQKVVPVSTVLCACVLRCVFVSACAHTLAGEPATSMPVRCSPAVL